MKLIFITLMTCSLLGVKAYSYSLRDFVKETAQDSKEALEEGPYPSYFLDFLEKDGEARHKAGATINVLRWKFISVAPGVTYATANSDEKLDAVIAFPIQILKIPIGQGETLGTYFEDAISKVTSEEWRKRLFAGLYMAHNTRTGKFGFGFNAGFRLW